MKALKHILIIALLCIIMPTTDAFARRRHHHRHHHRRTSFFISIGGFYPFHHRHCYGHYYYHHFGWPYYWDYYPYTVVERPVIVERPTVIVKQKPAPVQDCRNTSTDEDTQKLFASIRSKKAEHLRRLRIGDKDQKIKAIKDLAGLSYDDKVKQSLTDILQNDPDPDLRKEAAQAFGNAKNHTVLSILEQVRVDDDDVDMRKAADDAIKKIKG